MKIATSKFMIQVDELRCKLEEKNKMIEKKTQAALGATQDKNRLANELSEIRDQVDIKDRKINVLQRKVCCFVWLHFPSF